MSGFADVTNLSLPMRVLYHELGHPQLFSAPYMFLLTSMVTMSSNDKGGDHGLESSHQSLQTKLMTCCFMIITKILGAVSEYVHFLLLLSVNKLC